MAQKKTKATEVRTQKLRSLPYLLFKSGSDSASPTAGSSGHRLDLHAIILHQLGLDHEKLTFRHAGRDFRLTNFHGHVVKEIIA